MIKLKIMAGFSLKENIVPVEYKKLRHNGGVFAIGDVVVWDRTSDAYDVTTHALSNATTLNLCGISMEATTSSSTTVLVALIAPDQKWSCESANAANTSHNGLRVGLTDANTVNNDGSDGTSTSDLFMQTGVAGTEVVGRFIIPGQVTA